jgi:hypothetical protein
MTLTTKRGGVATPESRQCKDAVVGSHTSGFHALSNANPANRQHQLLGPDQPCPRWGSSKEASSC